MAYVKDPNSKPKAAPKVQHGQKRIALTTRKTKPDGSNEVMHKVEHHFDPVPFMKKMKRMRHDGSMVEDQVNSRDTHTAIAHGTPHHRGDDLSTTLKRLRAYRMREGNATAGDGRLERSAPAYAHATPEDPAYPYNEEDPYAIGYGVSHQAGDAENQPVGQADPSLIPFLQEFIERQRRGGSQDF